MHSHTKGFLTPYQHRHRFFEAVECNCHNVISIPCGSSIGNMPRLTQTIVELHEIWDLDKSANEVGFLTGAINQTTVVAVTSSVGQNLMDELELEPSARIWTPTARYYLFDYIEPTASCLSKCKVPGLRIVNDGEWIPYPGNLMDGYLVHWEHDPWTVGTHPLPDEFWDRCLQNSA